MGRKEKNNETQTLSTVDLPSSWELATIGGLVGEDGVFTDGDWVESKDQDPNGDVRLIQLADIGDGEYRDRSSRFLTYKKALELRCTFIDKGDVLVARMPDPLGRACIFPGDKKTSVTVVDVCIIRPGNDDISKRWLMYFINAPAFRAAVASLESGSTRKRISRKNLARISFPVPPSDEQKRIVAEIEKQFSRLDEAVENLKRVKANLKRYKASVLKVAVEGKLTEEWREKHPDVEPADKFSQRILAERRKKWEEAELAKMKKAGKVPKDDKWKKKYREPSQADISTLDELPNGWHWLTSDQLFWFVTSGSRGWAKYYSDSGAVFLRIGNLYHDSVSLDLKKVRFVTPPRGAEETRTRVEKNDILISITADVGMIGVIPRGFDEAYINQHISLARPISSVNSLYIAWYLTSRLGQNQFSALQRGATKAGLGLDDIRSVNIPMPPFKEQEEIISQIEKKLSIVDKIEIEVDENLKHTDRLRQSILKKAFSGKLVKPILGEEPVAVLLERIRRERRKKEKTQKPAAKKGKRIMTVKDTYLTLEEVDADHLSKILAQNGVEIDPKSLWQESKLTIDDFYAQLKREVEGNLIEETSERLLKLIA